MSTVILLVSLPLLFYPPIAAMKGRGWRGLWFALATAAAMSALLFRWLLSGTFPPGYSEPAKDFFFFLFSASFVALCGFLLAGIIYRKPFSA